MRFIVGKDAQLIKRKLEIVSTTMDFSSVFSKAADHSISTLYSQLGDKEAKLQKARFELNEYKRSNDIEELTKELENLYVEEFVLEQEVLVVQEQLTALMEMSVVALYKSYELKLKELATISFPESGIDKVFKWDQLVKYYKKHNIKFTELPGYEEADQLRIVNNNIKHGDSIREDVRKIEEFSGTSRFTFESLNNFYRRVESDVTGHLSQLSTAVVSELF
ncbi:hypothetical protein HRJ45_12470 [Vibrio coralliilyticus]|uniref:hypothetical protein n=1 Tax=Vibrio coralliilyticus TaxID=190893 RepID=UPI001560AEAE|nr:hypothetical protein [Vibrio coralliilyticus]NRF25887.1 hypothetical protein [Vibrio coralliilyticus]NRF79924.1 hypothetical protein [Vibrio coralliilyticus]